MKVLILGSTGMAGHMVEKYLKTQDYDITTAARHDANLSLDIQSSNSVVKFLNELTEQYSFVINCIGLLVKPCIDDPANAVLINSLLPRLLERHFKETPTRIIHLSTDCIFDGATGNYNEDSVPTETNIYGRSKLLGELNNNKDITFRMSIIGHELKNGTGLLNWVLTNERDELPGWSNVWWNGITTLQLAKCIDQYMKNPSVSGIYHLTHTPSSDSFLQINKYQLLQKINNVYKLNKKIIDTSATKNINKVLVNNRHDEMDFNIPTSYDTMLAELKEFANDNT